MRRTPQPQDQKTNIALWILSLLCAAFFLAVGMMMYLGMMDDPFAAWGFSPGFAALIGVFEIVGGIALLFKRSAGWGALGLMVLMIGALVTHAVHGEYWAALIPALVLLLLGVVLAGRGLRWRQLRQLTAANTTTAT
jgi:putative oxidoreductase